jgi:EmrB/QacA subfamily drug resistance transporter
MTTQTLDRSAQPGAAPSVAARAVAPSGPSETLHWPTLLIILTGVFMSALDVFIVNVAIPATQSELHASDSAVQWIVAGFALAVAAGVITAGRLGDIFGRRRMFSLGLALFTLASAACGIAPTAGFLIGARVTQGIAAALLTPQVLAILSTAFTGAALTKAYTAYGLVMGLAAIFGQLVGGVLISADLFGLGWRACFLINMPVGIAALALVKRHVPESVQADAADRSGRRLDWPGTVLLTGALIAVVLPLIQGRQQGWPVWTWVSFALGAALVADFAWYEHRLVRAGRAPLLNPSLFRERAFSVGMLVQVIAWTGQASFFLVLAVYLQNGVGLSALDSGLLFITIGFGYVVTATLSGSIATRLGRQTVAIGAAAMILGLVLMDLGVGRIGAGSGHGSVLWLAPGLIVDGAGMGLIIAPLASLVLARVEPKHAGAASGVLSMVMQLGGALGGQHGKPVQPYGHAFTSSTYLLVAVAASVMAGIQLLPRHGGAAPATTREGETAD